MDNSGVNNEPHKKKKSVGILIVVLVLIAVIAAAIIVPKLYTNNSVALQQPSFAFITTQQLKSIYHENFTGENYTQNITKTSLNLSGSTYSELQKAEMWLYAANGTGNSISFNLIAVLILEAQNSSDAAKVYQVVMKGIEKSSTLKLIGNGSFMNFAYSEYEINTSSSLNATIYFAHNGKFILLQEFIGTSTSNSLVAFHTQIKDMY